MYEVKQIGDLRYFNVGEFKTKKEATAAAEKNAAEVADWETCEKVTGPNKKGEFTVKLNNGTSFKIFVSKVE